MPSRPKFLGGGTRSGATDFFHFSLAYAKQEALEPVVRQAKAMGRGILGAIALATGTVLLGLGFVRALQAELGHVAGPGPIVVMPTTSPHSARLYAIFSSQAAPYGFGSHLSGDWSWVPYMGGALLCLLVAAFCVFRALKGAK